MIISVGLVLLLAPLLAPAMGFILANGLGCAAMFTFIADAAFLYINVCLLRRVTGQAILGVAVSLPDGHSIPYTESVLQ